MDAVHADEQMNQFTIAQSQVGYADRILLTKTDVAGEAEKLRERPARINARAPVYTVTHGDIDWPAVQHQRFYAGRKRRQHQATFSLYRGQTKRYFVDCGGTGLPGRYQRSFSGDGKPLLESADKLLRYKGMLWIDGEPNRLLFQGVQRLYSADWDCPWGDENRIARWCLSGFSCQRKRFGQRLLG